MRLDSPAGAYYNHRMRSLALAAVLAFPCGAFAAETKAPAAPAARLIKVAGDVTIQTKDGGRLAKGGEALASGDAVSTSEKATALIELADGSRLKLRESSRLALTLPDAKSPDTEAFLSLGSVFAKVRKRLAGQDFRVRTPNAVAAVRGTEFFTAFGRARGKDKDLWVCVNEGAVDIETKKSKSATRVSQGEGVLIKGGKDTTKPQAYDWTKSLNWNMDENGELEDKTNLDGAYADLLDQDYR